MCVKSRKVVAHDTTCVDGKKEKKRKRRGRGRTKGRNTAVADSTGDYDDPFIISSSLSASMGVTV